MNSQLASERYLLQLEGSLGTKTAKNMKFVEAAAQIEGSFASRGLQKLANVEINAQRIRVVMAAPILFASGSAELNVNALPILSELSKILQALPNKVTVEGHSCDLPVGARCKYRSNLELSGARAFSVIRYFIEMGKTDPDKFVALGCGENRPVSPNDCEENRSKNRRVEIIIEK
jgi:chemotaxis protein MotB